jgi:hypothetical protein
MRHARLAAVLGGFASNAKATPEQKEAWGTKGGSTTLARYGQGFFRHIQKERWRKHREQKKNG